MKSKFRQLRDKRDINKINLQIMQEIVNIDTKEQSQEYWLDCDLMRDVQNLYKESEKELKEYKPSLRERLDVWIHREPNEVCKLAMETVEELKRTGDKENTRYGRKRHKQ
jgi:hypothetical protein